MKYLKLFENHDKYYNYIDLSTYSNYVSYETSYLEKISIKEFEIISLKFKKFGNGLLNLNDKGYISVYSMHAKDQKGPLWVTIRKIKDDYFLIYIQSLFAKKRKESQVKCDQMDGLLKWIDDYFQQPEIKLKQGAISEKLFESHTLITSISYEEYLTKIGYSDPDQDDPDPTYIEQNYEEFTDMEIKLLKNMCDKKRLESLQIYNNMYSLVNIGYWEGSVHQFFMRFNITKLKDEWYYINDHLPKAYRTGFWKCDQFDSVIELLDFLIKE